MILDFDWLGILIFLWFIFSGFKNSQKAKQKHEQRRREGQRPPRPITNTKKSRPSMPMDSPKSEPMFEQHKHKAEPRSTKAPLEEKEQRAKKVQKEVMDKIETVKEKTIEKPKPVKPNKLDTIKSQEAKWKAAEGDFTIDQKAVVNGLVWAEVLGPPRAKQKKIR